MPMACNYFMCRSLLPPLGKPRTSKSPDIPAVYHSQTASPDGGADTDTNERQCTPKPPLLTARSCAPTHSFRPGGRPVIAAKYQPQYLPYP